MTVSAHQRQPRGAPAPRRRRGFTLIELVIVVVVLAVLAGLAVVGWNSRTRSAYNTAAARAVEAVGDAVGTHAKAELGDDFDYSTANVSSRVSAHSTDIHASADTISDEYGEYASAAGTDPVTGESRAVLVMKSVSGDCAVTVFGKWGAQTAQTTVAAVSPCEASDTTLAAVGLADAATIGPPAPPQPLHSATSTVYNLTSMCKPSPAEGKLRIRNNSGTPQYFSLRQHGSPAAPITGLAPTGDSYIDVTWTASSNTWILSIDLYAGTYSYHFTKAVGNNPICT